MRLPFTACSGATSTSKGALREALSHTRRAVELSPSSELAARDHFHVLYDLGLLSEAREELLRFQSRTQSVELRREWSRLIAEVDSHLFDRT